MFNDDNAKIVEPKLKTQEAERLTPVEPNSKPEGEDPVQFAA